MKYLSILILHFLLISQLFAQDSLVTFHGFVIDKETSEPLAYANIGLKARSIGTTTNESGEYQLKVPSSYLSDTLTINFLGYDSYETPLNQLKNESTIKLKSSAFDLDEVIIRPQPPTFYIQLGVKNIPDNYPSEPFNSLSYFKQSVYENKKPLKASEAAFYSYFPTYIDSSKTNQHQAVLYREPNKLYDLEFDKKRREKQIEKQIKKAEKEGETEFDTATAIAIAEAFSGPQSVLNTDIVHAREFFLDSNYFKKFDYEFGQPTTYLGKDVMVIHFESKSKVEHTKQEGSIYLDATTYAIIRYHYSGVMVVPAYIKPIIFMAGYGVENPTFNRKVEYTFHKGKWYPRLINTVVDLELERKHWFSENEVSNFNMQQGLLFNEIFFTDNVIPEEIRYKTSDPIKEQVHNTLHLNWDMINSIR